MKNIFLIILALFTFTAMAYINPIQGVHDSPDPGVLYDGHNFYAVTTEGWDSHYFPIWKSPDLFKWSQQGFVFLTKPSWAVQNFWAPEMHIVGHQYLVYYTARDSTGFLCIGVAYSDSPLGPFIDKGVPLLKNVTEGVIDCTIHQENNQIHLIYKVDGNAHGKPT
jgi:beta-xylosidase